MEHGHLVSVQQQLPYAQWNRIHVFNEICFGENTDVMDPLGDRGYICQDVFRRIERGCRVLATRLSNKINESE